MEENSTEIQQPGIEQLFDNFLYLAWSPNPLKDNVSLIIDGEQKWTLKRDKFIQLVKSTVKYTDINVKNLVGLIELSISEFGGWYFYDRTLNTFKELREEPKIEKLMPKDIKNGIEKTKETNSLISDNMQELYNKISNPCIGLNKTQHKYKNINERYTTCLGF